MRWQSSVLVAASWVLLGVLVGGCVLEDERTLVIGAPTPLAPAPTPPASTPTATPTPYFYRVQPGDTLWQIAQRHGMDVEALILANELENPGLLQPGQELLISDRVTVSGEPFPTATATPIRCAEGCLQQPPGCEVKGIVTRLEGVRVYLLPEDELYPWRAADVWFCRAEDAQRAGWQRWTPHGPAQP